MAETTFAADPKTQDIVVTREFDAPRDLVFKVLTDPTLIPRWWGPRQYTTRVDKMDVRPGGQWRFVHQETDGSGTEHAFHGVYHAVVPPERIVQTFEWEGFPGHVAMETMTLEEVGGKTRMTVTSVFQTVADRDGMWATGMQSGARDTHDRLEELLQTLKTEPVKTR
jgi:uncharacterized protein YndB with AHSA1/START domain